MLRDFVPLQKPLILTCSAFVVVVHDPMVDVHHNVVALILQSFVQYQDFG